MLEMGFSIGFACLGRGSCSFFDTSLKLIANVWQQGGSFKGRGVSWCVGRTWANSGSACFKFPFKEHCVSCDHAQRPAAATGRAEVGFLEDSRRGAGLI